MANDMSNCYPNLPASKPTPTTHRNDAAPSAANVRDAHAQITQHHKDAGEHYTQTNVGK